MGTAGTSVLEGGGGAGAIDLERGEGGGGGGGGAAAAGGGGAGGAAAAAAAAAATVSYSVDVEVKAGPPPHAQQEQQQQQQPPLLPPLFSEWLSSGGNTATASTGGDVEAGGVGGVAGVGVGAGAASGPQAMTQSCLAQAFPFLPLEAMGCCGLNGDSKEDAEEAKNARAKNKEIDRMIQKDKQVYRATHRLLLLGAGESGKSTLVKQVWHFV